MSTIFGVSTDYLLKDDAEPAEDTAPPIDAPQASEEAARMITMEEADRYMTKVQMTAPRIALGVTLCILSPIVLFLLGGLSDKEGGYLLPEWSVPAIGLPVLLLFVVIGVAQFILYGRQLEDYEFLEKQPIELAYGVRGVVEKRKNGYAPLHSQRLMIGVGICIFAAAALFIGAALEGVNEDTMYPVIGVAAMLAIAAVGVYFIVLTCTLQGSYQRLLEEGDYTRERKSRVKRNENLATAYWCLVTAIFLLWSFLTMDWHQSWLVWPVAGVLYGAVSAVANMIRK